MKNAENAQNVNYRQIDHKIIQLAQRQGLLVLPISQAYKKYSWVRSYFKAKPAQGYFIWVKKSLADPINTWISICSLKISQNLDNLIVVEKNVKAKASSVCQTKTKTLLGKHNGCLKIVLKENSKLELNHFHHWGEKDMVVGQTDFFLAKKAKLVYEYKCFSAPLKLKLTTNAFLEVGACLNSLTTVLCRVGEADLQESAFLNGKKSNALLRFRVAALKDSKISAKSLMVANAQATGHLDCMGLLLGNQARINMEPSLLNKNPKAILTHEASVGKISPEILNYLRSRGLSKNRAIELIIGGFLKKQDSLAVNKKFLFSKKLM